MFIEVSLSIFAITDNTAPATQLGSVALQSISSPRRSIEGHYGVTERVHDRVPNTELHGDAFVDINDDSESRPDLAPKRIRRPLKLSNLQPYTCIVSS